jgi:integrase
VGGGHLLLGGYDVVLLWREAYTMTLQQILIDLYAPMTGICDRTITLYGYTLRSWGEQLGRPPETTDLEELAVARFLAHRVRSMSAATAAKDKAQLTALWGFCSRRKLCDTWPQTPRIIVPERIPEAWLADEFQRLIDSSRQEPLSYCGFPGSLVFPAMLLTAYSTGERIGAIMSLRCRDVRGCAVIFRAEDRKGRRRDIFRDISVACADALLAIRRGPEDTAIPWDKHPTYVYNRLKIILKRAGLPHGRQDKFHRVRKTTASYYEAAGGSAQRLLDHSSPAVTRRYLDPRIVTPGEPAPSVLPEVI